MLPKLTRAAAVLPLLLLATPGSAAAQGNPACALLSEDDIKSATGIDYGSGDEGDPMGEGAGGGTSCQWGGPTFAPGPEKPLLSVVFIPPGKGSGYTEAGLKMKAREGCTRETLRDIGDLGYLETCAKGRGPVAYVKTGKNDLIVQLDAGTPDQMKAAKTKVVALAQKAAAKAR